MRGEPSEDGPKCRRRLRTLLQHVAPWIAAAIVWPLMIWATEFKFVPPWPDGTDEMRELGRAAIVRLPIVRAVMAYLMLLIGFASCLSNRQFVPAIVAVVLAGMVLTFPQWMDGDGPSQSLVETRETRVSQRHRDHREPPHRDFARAAKK